MSRAKKKAAPAPKPLGPWVYRWSDQTSYSQRGPDARGEKDPTHWRMGGKRENDSFLATSPISILLSRESDGMRIRVELGGSYTATAATPEAAAIEALDFARRTIARRLERIDELIANPPKFPAKGGW